jgi:predicted O-methyltransferase YrrM
MAAALPRLAGRRDRASRSLATALRTTALGRVPPQERAWIERIEARRRELASVGRAPSYLPVASRWMSVPPAWGVFLMRLLRELCPRSCLELGTGFGISAAYQAAALELNGAGTLTTLEAADQWAGIAQQGLSTMELDARVELELGPIADTLQGVLKRTAPVDYALLDAEHTERATVEQFDALVPHLSATAVVVVDDIAWSKEMRSAWRTISRRERISIPLGLRRVGIAVVNGRPRSGGADT